jgi:hypothetical protein
LQELKSKRRTVRLGFGQFEAVSPPLGFQLQRRFHRLAVALLQVLVTLHHLMQVGVGAVGQKGSRYSREMPAEAMQGELVDGRVDRQRHNRNEQKKDKKLSADAHGWLAFLKRVPRPLHRSFNDCREQGA